MKSESDSNSVQQFIPIEIIQEYATTIVQFKKVDPNSYKPPYMIQNDTSYSIQYRQRVRVFAIS